MPFNPHMNWAQKDIFSRKTRWSHTLEKLQILEKKGVVLKIDLENLENNIVFNFSFLKIRKKLFGFYLVVFYVPTLSY